MIRSRGLHRLSALLALVALTLGVTALATAARDPRLYADCDGYTITVTGDNFEPGEVLPVDYFIIMSIDGAIVEVSGSFVLEDVGLNPFTTSFSYDWPFELCGEVEILTDFGGRPTRIEYFETVKVPMTIEPGSERFFCPCDEEEELICRSPGFWGTHAGEEKRGSQNIAQEVIDAVGFLDVCGEMLDATDVCNQRSALEGICVSPRGDQRLQLIRQLTAAALNCAFTSGDSRCEGLEIGALIERCNDACIFEDEAEIATCIHEVDCFNNGGVILEDGFCQTGTCGADGETACYDDADCGLDAAGEHLACVPTPGNCHSRELVNEELGLYFDPPGPAGSPKACRDARKNDCTILGCTCTEESGGGKGRGGKGDKGKDKGKDKGGKGGRR